MSQDIEKNLNQIKDLLSGGNSQDNIKNMLSLLVKPSSEGSSNTQADEGKNSSGSFDADTLQMFFKIKQILDASQKGNDPREKLLNSLKPYLNDKRKDKLADCLMILKLTTLWETFTKLEGSEHNAKSKHQD
ncbi:MAG: hypothetical protein ACM3KR_02995 [Deltaproteobacteria bacterium]